MRTDDLQQIILDAFKAVLKNNALDADENFFHAGGDSVLATKAALRIAEATGQEVNPAMAFLYPTASSLATVLADEAQADVS